MIVNHTGLAAIWVECDYCVVKKFFHESLMNPYHALMRTYGELLARYGWKTVRTKDGKRKHACPDCRKDGKA